MKVVLQSGAEQDLAELSGAQLDVLHWEQERAFARAIEQSPRGSTERGEALRTGYDTVTKILSLRQTENSGPFTMGLCPRHVQLVSQLLRSRSRQIRRRARFFEIGFGCGAMLEAVARAGYEVSGIEVSSHMHQQACHRLPAACHKRLLLGDLLAQNGETGGGPYDVVYWNDVFEHLPTNESLDYLRHIHGMLAEGGRLVTVTPNWHSRPNDVTADYRPPRCEPEGFHLKEYTLREMAGLLRDAGFRNVTTPLFVSPQRVYLRGTGLLDWKCRHEPWLERMPFTLADLLIRGLGLNTSIAQR